jgi:PAS domain S-box-containing protein
MRRADQDKSKKELLTELRDLRERNEELESLLIECKRAIDANYDARHLFEVAQDLIDLKRAQWDLQKERDYFKNVLDNSADAIGIVDAKGRFIRWNKRAEELFGYSFEELEGKSAFELYADKAELEQMLEELRAKSYVRDYEIVIRTRDGCQVPFSVSISMLKDAKGQNLGSVCVARDLSQIKQVQEALRESNDKLEQRVQERTTELISANTKLEEANIALRVLLEQKDEHKRVYVDNMLFNVKQLIVPLLEKLKVSGLQGLQQEYIHLIEANLEEFLSPYKRELTHSFGLTPTEIQLLEQIKQGKTTKEIAGLLNLSKRTIDTHRHNIRKKLGLQNTNVNLRSYLLSADGNHSEPGPAHQ